MFHRTCAVLLFATLAASLVALGPAARSAPGSVSTGQSIAQRDCTQCHVITPGGGSGWTSAPSFESIANRQNETASALSAYIQKSHLHMLHDKRTPADANAIAAYIMSLKAQ